MTDILLRCQFRASAVPEGQSPLFVARLACAALDQDLPASDPVWPVLAPWRWTDVRWLAARDDRTFDPAAVPETEPSPALGAEAVGRLERRLGLAEGWNPARPAAASAVRLELLPGALAEDPKNVVLTPLPTHGGRTWLNTLEGLGTGPGVVARHLGLVSLLRPAARLECLTNRYAFAPAFSIDGQTYTPSSWEKVLLPATTELDPTNREALYVTFDGPADAPGVRALLLPSLDHPVSPARSYVSAETLEVALGEGGQTARFDRDWPAGYARRLSEVFDLTARLSDPVVVGQVYASAGPRPSDDDVQAWRALLEAVFVALARDASGTGVMATADRTFPVTRLLDELTTLSGANEAALAPEARDAILASLATYEARFAASDWATAFAAFQAMQDAQTPAAVDLAGRLGSWSALLTRQDITANLVLRQFWSALAGPDDTGYDLPAGERLRIAQGYVAPQVPGGATGWVSLLSASTGEDTSFGLDLRFEAGASLGTLCALELAPEPDGAMAGAATVLELERTAPGQARLTFGGEELGQVEITAAGACRVRLTLTLPGGHGSVGINRIGLPPLPLDRLGGAPPLIRLRAEVPLTAVKFGAAGIRATLGALQAAPAGEPGPPTVFRSPLAERLAKLDPQGWLVQAAPTLIWSDLAGQSIAAPSGAETLRDRLLASAAAAFAAFVEARFSLGADHPLLSAPAGADPARRAHLLAALKARFAKTYGDPAARESAALLPLASDDAQDLPLPDAHPIVVPYDLGDAITFNDLLAETTGVAVLVEADGRAFARGAGSFANTYTLNAARVQFAWGGHADELAIGDRPGPQAGLDIRTFKFDARPLVAPLKSEQLSTSFGDDRHDDEFYHLLAYDASDGPLAWGRTIAQMRFGWFYGFCSFFVGQGGVLPHRFWDGATTRLRRPAVGEKVFGQPIHYLCRAPVSTPRWDARQTDAAITQVPAGARPLAGELPDLPPPVNVFADDFATFYVSEADGSGLIACEDPDPGAHVAPIEIRLYGLHLQDGAEARLSLRRGRISGPADELLSVRLRAGAAGQVVVSGAEVVVDLPGAAADGAGAGAPGEYHIALKVAFEAGRLRVQVEQLAEVGDDGAVLPTLEPDQMHLRSAIGEATPPWAGATGDLFLRVDARKGDLRLSPPRVWVGPHRVVCPETAGQQPDIVALDTRRPQAVLKVRPPAATFRTWVRHLLSDVPLDDPTHRVRIDKAYQASQSRSAPGASAVDATLDHPRVERLFVELTPLFPRARTAGTLYEIPLTTDLAKDPYGDRKTGLSLTIRRAPSSVFNIDEPKAVLQVAGQTATVTMPAGEVAELRIYAATPASDYSGPTARFAPGLARGRRREGSYVLSAPLRLRVEAAVDERFLKDVVRSLAPNEETFWRERLTPLGADHFAVWGRTIGDGVGNLMAVEARPTLAPPATRQVARLMRVFAAVTIAAQAWSWRGRPGAEAPVPPARTGQEGPGQAEVAAYHERYRHWSAKMFYGRVDTDAEYQGPIALTPHHIRAADSLSKAAGAPVTVRDLGYFGKPRLWRFALEFHGRYPDEPRTNRSTLTSASTGDEAVRHGRWAHLLAPGALAASRDGPMAPRELRRPPLDLWLPLSEKREPAASTPPILLLFAETWHARGDLGDTLQLVSLLARHPKPDPLAPPGDGTAWRSADLAGLFGHKDFAKAEQYRKYWQSWGPDPILTAEAAPFGAVSLALRGPMGWSQSEGAISDFRRSGFQVEPAVHSAAITDLLAWRPMFQLAYRRVADPGMMRRLTGFDPGLIWTGADDVGSPDAPRRRIGLAFGSGQVGIAPPEGYQGLRLDWSLATPRDGAPIDIRIDDGGPTGQAPRRFLVQIERQGSGVRLRCAMSEPLTAASGPEWAINHLPPVHAPMVEETLQLRIDISPTAASQPDAQEDGPDTFDVLVWVRSAADADWQGGCLARFKAPMGKGLLHLSLPGTPESLSTARLQPIVLSPFSAGVWCQFGSDSSSFLWAFAGSSTRVARPVEDLRLLRDERRSLVFLRGVVEDAATTLAEVLPIVPEDRLDVSTPKPEHRLIAVVTQWITDVKGRRSEKPLFAAPLVKGTDPRCHFPYPKALWPSKGRLRLVTVLATAEAAKFKPIVTEDAPFAVMEQILGQAPKASENPFDLNFASSEMSDASLLIVGVSRPVEIE